MKYLVQRAESSFCPDCDRNIFLLCEEDGEGPQFYICFRCRYVGHIGKARLEVPDPQVIANNPKQVDRGWLMAFVADVSARLANLRQPMTNDMAAIALSRASTVARKLALREK